MTLASLSAPRDGSKRNTKTRSRPRSGTTTKRPEGSSTIEFELEPSGAGTILKFRHYGLPGAEAAQSHAHGWDHYLARLVIAGRGGDPGEDRGPEGM